MPAEVPTRSRQMLPLPLRCAGLCRRGLHLSAPLFRQATKKTKPRKPLEPPRKFLREKKHAFYKYRTPYHLSKNLETDPREATYALLKCYYPQWHQDRIALRLRSLGIARKEYVKLLDRFRTAIHNGTLPLDSYDPQTLSGIVRALNNSHDAYSIDKTVTRMFIDFATSEGPSTNDVDTKVLQSIREATDFSHPAEWFPEARSIKRRIIMHVGPTNSGKTHQALQALAAAKTGYYAGPLRLLAYEIWDRLNKGQIVPAGVTIDPSATADDDGGSDLLDGIIPTKPPVLTKEHNDRFARACNLITGEERRIVAEDALVSCTVEMLQFDRFVDVAVVDEIQMIADPARGSSWTAAVLGLCAKEIHLCGEETTVDIIKDLVEDTGDELIVNRYQRLTPLSVADRSLDGNLKRIEKGDCVVAFSRSGIFALKKRIEDMTNLRCAVAYGRLPPEIRSEQAALFNDPNSGFDVIVGSDAIGMGLNLYVFNTQPPVCIVHPLTGRSNGSSSRRRASGMEPGKSSCRHLKSNKLVAVLVGMVYTVTRPKVALSPLFTLRTFPLSKPQWVLTFLPSLGPSSPLTSMLITRFNKPSPSTRHGLQACSRQSLSSREHGTLTHTGKLGKVKISPNS